MQLAGFYFLSGCFLHNELKKERTNFFFSRARALRGAHGALLRCETAKTPQGDMNSAR